MSDPGEDDGIEEEDGDDVIEKVEDESQKWHGYSDYQNVAVDLRKETNKAIEAYAHINSRHSSGMAVTPQTAVNVKAAILRITKRLYYEVKKNVQIDEFGDIYERWAGVSVEEADEGYEIIDDPDDPGYVSMLEDTDFSREAPSWLDQLVDDIITAGWELGYIRAGKEKPADPDDDEEQIEGMFE